MACSITRARTRRWRRSTRLPPTIAATAAPPANWPATASPASGFLPNSWPRRGYELSNRRFFRQFGLTVLRPRRKRHVNTIRRSSHLRATSTAEPMAFVRILLGAERRWNALAAALLAAAGILVLVTFADYGVTWDEDVHNWYGVFALDYYLSLFSDQRALNWLNLYNYGAAFDMTAAAFNKFSPLGIYETRHLLNGLVGLVGLAGCWKLGRALGGSRAGFLALLFLLVTPNYYGQMFNNPKDIPFAVGGVWATYYMVRILPSLPYPPWRLLLKMGLAIGLALGVRVGGLLFLCYLGLLLGLSAAWQGIAARRLSLFITTGLTSLWRVLPPVAVAAAVIADRALARLSALPYRAPIYAALGLYGIAHIATMVMLHPDQYVYYNGFVGGVDGAQRKFKLDYWANSYAEAVRGLEDYLRHEYGADFEEREFTVAVCGPPISARYYFPDNFRLVHRQDRAEFFIAFTKDDCDRLFP